jgi:TonB family protein
MSIVKHIFFLSFLTTFVNAQVNPELDPTTRPVNVGGLKQLEHLVKTQLYIADAFTRVADRDATIYFVVTKQGKVTDPFFKDKYPDFYMSEMKRMLRFFLFEPGKTGGVPVDAYGSITINFSGAKYKNWLKERSKPKVNLNMPADTSFVIYDAADKSPEFNKGDDAMAQFIVDNIEYPNVAKLQTIEGTVVLSFIVEANGFVSNVTPIKSVNGGCTEEAIRVMMMVRFKPAEKNGKYVRYKMQYPITFSLKNINKDNSNSQQ